MLVISSTVEIEASIYSASYMRNLDAFLLSFDKASSKKRIAFLSPISPRASAE
jgi:menaquinone-dependent protoporphyrinogen IX oxidase